MDGEFTPNPDGPVLVVGTAGVDIVGRFKGELRIGTSLPAQIHTTFGGVGRNVLKTWRAWGSLLPFFPQ